MQKVTQMRQSLTDHQSSMTKSKLPRCQREDCRSNFVTVARAQPFIHSMPGSDRWA